MRILEVFPRRQVDQTLPHDDHVKPETLPEPDAPWRGPHEGRYLTLLLNGTKPMAMIRISHLPAYRPYIDAGKLVVEPITVFNNEQQYAIAVPDQQWRIPRLRKLYQTQDDITNNKLWNAKVGILLGYSNEDIRKFIHRRDTSLEEFFALDLES